MKRIVLVTIGLVLASSSVARSFVLSGSVDSRRDALKSIEYDCGWIEVEDPLQGQCVSIEYKAPSADYFRGDALTWFGELRAHADSRKEELSEEKTISRMLVSDGKNGWKTEIVLPLGVREIVFAVTDGVRFDTNENNLYRVRLPFYFESKQGDSFELFRAEDNKSLGMIHRRSATELEDATRSALAQEENKNSQSEQPPPAAREVVQVHNVPNEQTTERGDHLSFEHLKIAVSKEEQAAFQDSRARATALGESLGLSNIEIGDVRMAFERHCTDRRKSDSPLLRNKFNDFLRELGFDEVVDNDRQHPLWNDFVHHDNHDQDAISLETCLRIYHHLDVAGEGLAII